MAVAILVVLVAILIVVLGLRSQSNPDWRFRRPVSEEFPAEELGPEAHTTDLRQQIRAVLYDTVNSTDGTWDPTMAPDPTDYSPMLEWLSNLTKTFREEAPPQTSTALLGLLQTDPDWAVREVAAILLLRHDADRAGEVVRHIANDPQWRQQSPLMVVGTARYAPREAVSGVQIIADQHADDSVRAKAIAALAAMPNDLGGPALQGLLERTRGQTRAHVLRALTSSGSVPATSELIELLRPAVDEDSRCAAIEILGDGPHFDAVESALMTCLRADEPRVSVAAAEALGRLGTRAAVQSLRELARESGDSNVDGAARDAVEAIQVRLQADGGRLSVAAGVEGGAVSLAQPTDGGTLSTADDLPSSAAEPQLALTRTPSQD